MSTRLFVDAAVEKELEDEAATELKETVSQKLEEFEEIASPRVMLKEESGTTTLGFSVKTNLKELANNPANGRYLGLFIVDEDEEIVSEKFILNPAIKLQRGRFSLVLDILQQNNVDKFLIATAPEEEQLALLEKQGVEHEVAPTNKLDKLRSAPEKLLT